MKFLVDLWNSLFTAKHFEDAVVSLLKVEGQVPAKYIKTILESRGYRLSIFDFYLAMSKLEDRKVVKSVILTYYEHTETSHVAEVHYRLVYTHT